MLVYLTLPRGICKKLSEAIDELRGVHNWYDLDLGSSGLTMRLNPNYQRGGGLLHLAWGFILIRRVEKGKESLVFNLSFQKAFKIVSN